MDVESAESEQFCAAVSLHKIHIKCNTVLDIWNALKCKLRIVLLRGNLVNLKFKERTRRKEKNENEVERRNEKSEQNQKSGNKKQNKIKQKPP